MPKWLRKLQPGKILVAAAQQLPVIGGAISAVGAGAQTAVATAQDLSTAQGRSQAQSLVQSGRELIDDAKQSTALVPIIAVGIAVVLLVVLMRKR